MELIWRMEQNPALSLQRAERRGRGTPRVREMIGGGPPEQECPRYLA